jgi:hypothetical protein
MKIGGRGFSPVHRSEIELGSNPVACFSETSFFKETKPFVLGVGPGGITTIAIAKYMKKFLGYPIEVNYHFPNSQDITKSVIKGEFDPAMAEGVVLSQTCTSRLSNSKCAYKPFMLVPGTTNMLLSTKSIEKRDISGSLSFLTDQESAATLIFHDLVVSGYFKKDLIEPIYFEPGNTLSKEIDFSILWWPYYRFNELLGKAKRVPSFKDSFCHFSVYMFVHEQLLADTKRATLLSKAFKKAWLNLRLNPDILNEIVADMVADRDYMSFLYLCNGVNDPITLKNLSLSSSKRPLTVSEENL